MMMFFCHWQHLHGRIIKAPCVHAQTGFAGIPLSRSVGFTFCDNSKRNIDLKIAGNIAAFDRKLLDNYGMKPTAGAAGGMSTPSRSERGKHYPISAVPIEPE
jgi:hypothetical protein